MPLDWTRRQGGRLNPPWATGNSLSTELAWLVPGAYGKTADSPPVGGSSHHRLTAELP
jgi:hypothetical protein